VVILEGRVHTFEDHIDTDVIIPNEFLTQPDRLAEGCFSKVYPGFHKRVRQGDLIFAGENFGCGSSREHAPIAIKAVGIAAVVAASFGRIFFRSAINIGLPAVECPEAVAEARDGGEGAVDFVRGVVTVDGRDFAFPQYPPQVLDILEAGGLVSFMSRRLSAATRQVSVP
jgi:3-isopropylmalate/(R)-2-methylmalate dehydratase small subunit